MSNYYTNGYILSRILTTAADRSHKDQASADEYLKQFRAMEQTFFEKIHPFVDVGLMISEVLIANGSKPNIFTVHGSRHISDLIRSMDKMVEAIEKSNQSFRITALEAYILLCGAHVHDSANVEKRDQHPEKCKDLLKEYNQLFVHPIHQEIYNVARVHGGRRTGFGNDTIRSIDSTNTIDGPRLPLLAAILRLSDELSENANRVPKSVTNSHEHSALSKLAHAYATSFSNFELRNESLYIVYNVYPSQRDLVVEDNESKYTRFIDFLEMKIDAIERECRYCSQYGHPNLHIAQISVRINKYDEEIPCDSSGSEQFELHLSRGYPGDLVPLCLRSQQLKEKSYEKFSDCFFIDSKTVTQATDSALATQGAKRE